MVPAPAAGPEVALTPLVTLTTALVVTVVVSVLKVVCAGVKPLVPVTVTSFFCPEVAVFGRVAATTNLKVAPAARAPVEVIAGPVGKPDPLSKKMLTTVIA